MIEWAAFKVLAGTVLKPLWALLSNPYVAQAIVIIVAVSASYALGSRAGRLDCEGAGKDAAIEAQGGRIAAQGFVFGAIETRFGEIAIEGAARQAREAGRGDALETFKQEIEAHAEGDAGCRITARDAELLNALDAAPPGIAGGKAVGRLPDH